LAGIQIRLTLSEIRTVTLLFLSLTFRQKKSNKTLTVCSVPAVCLKTALHKSGYDAPSAADGRTHWVLERREILFVSLVRDKHCFVLTLYL
jgi:hypothetical protein